MKKRMLALTLVLALALAAPAFAAGATAAESEAAQVLAALDIMTGDEHGNLNLDRRITRAEFTRLTVAASPYAESVGPAASVSPYPDVPKSHWAAAAVQAAKEKGLVSGYTDSTFRPMNDIALVEGVTMALRLLGYQDADFLGAWGSGQMALYLSLKLDKGISAGRDDPMTRGDALWLFYNLLTAKTKAGQIYLTTLGHALTPTGEIDRVALVNSAMEGPLVAEGSWQSALPFDAATATVYRAGSPAALTALRTTDVVYYSKPMRTLWAYTGKATGAIQGLAPSAAAPTSVTVGGRTYPIETSAAAYDLSDLGPFRAGDSVTLLLGRSGGVAAVRVPGETQGTVCGVVTAVGTGTYQDADGKSYTADTVTLTATDGQSYRYPWEDKNKKFEIGDLVGVTAADTGARLQKLTKTPLTGKADGLTFAPDAELLDVYGKANTLRVYPSRLAGVTFKGDMVRYYATNERGEISHMILNDVTGDIHGYGVLTTASETSGNPNPLLGLSINSTYAYDLGGVPGVYNSSKTIWNLKTGPCAVKEDGQTVDRISNLTGVALTAVEENRAIAANKTYTLADGVAVYELRDKNYYLTDLSRVTGGGYTLTGWYDKAEADGGRVRVVVAEVN